MSTNQVATLLDALTITLDPSLIQHITRFLHDHPQPPTDTLPPRLWTVAAAAVLADAARVQPVSGQGRVSYGAPIQQFLRHVEGGVRVQFLDAAARILVGWKQAPQNLAAKLKEVTLTFDVFSHYRTLFMRIGKEVGFAEGVAQRVMAAFWIVFLRAKAILAQRFKSAGSKGQLEVLFAVVDFAFEKVTTGVSHQEVSKAFSQEFLRHFALKQEERDLYHKHFWEILQKGYNFRYQADSRIDLKALVQNQDLLRRFVEGFTLILERERGSNFDQINELNYLELQLPPLTPLPQQHKPIPNNPLHELNTVLKYDEPQDCQQPFCNRTDLIDNFSSKKSPTAQLRAQLHFQQPGGDEVDKLFSHFMGEDEEDYAEVQRRRKRFVVNKCHSRILVLKWVQDQLRSAERAAEELAGLMGRNMDLKHYEESREERIMDLLEQVSSGCRNKKHRSAQIYRLFLAFLCKMRRGLKVEDLLAIITQPQRLDAVLCLTTIIFNYAYKAQDLSFEEYCHHFGVTILTGFVPLNWFGANADLPKELQTFLFELEERILLEQIWGGETGMQVFRVKNATNFIEMVMRKRFYKHVLHRIACICKNELVERDRNVVFKLVEEIVTNKLHLLRDNNIYIILICSLNICFGTVISLAKAIQALRKSENVGRLALQARDCYGYPVSIEEFYSSTFMREMEHITNTRRDALQFTPPAKITTSSAIRNTASSEFTSSFCIQTLRFGEDSLSKSQECRVGHYRKVLAVKIFQAPCHSSPKSPSGSLSEQDE